MGRARHDLFKPITGRAWHGSFSTVTGRARHGPFIAVPGQAWPVTAKSFFFLGYNGYLSCAHDILAVPMSIVASKSTFRADR